MIDRTHALPITCQAKIVNISRGSVYYESQPISDVASVSRTSEVGSVLMNGETI